MSCLGAYVCCMINGSGTFAWCRRCSRSARWVCGMTSSALRAQQMSVMLLCTRSKLACLLLPGDPSRPSSCKTQPDTRHGSLVYQHHCYACDSSAQCHNTMLVTEWVPIWLAVASMHHTNRAVSTGKPWRMWHQCLQSQGMSRCACHPESIRGTCRRGQ